MHAHASVRVYNSDIDDDDDEEMFTSSKVSEEGQKSSVQRTVIPQPTKRGWEPARPTRQRDEGIRNRETGRERGKGRAAMTKRQIRSATYANGKNGQGKGESVERIETSRYAGVDGWMERIATWNEVGLLRACVRACACGEKKDGDRERGEMSFRIRVRGDWDFEGGRERE